MGRGRREDLPKAECVRQAVWAHRVASRGGNWDDTCHRKQIPGVAGNWQDSVTLTFHDPQPATDEHRRKAVYVRSA